ncbi:MAG: TIM barrel protein [Acidobacteria bacterium]|nr:TIM barrel protein [Acidobacteriota bacterium]
MKQKTEVTRRGLMAAAGAISLPLLGWAKRTSRLKFGFTSYQWGKQWDIAALIKVCTEIQATGLELRVEMQSAHGVELALDAAQRRAVKRQFSGSPVRLLGLATGERFDYVDPAKNRASIEKAKQYLQLCHDIGGLGIRVFPNDFHKEVPREQTIDQIAGGVREVARTAKGLGLKVRLENHGSAGELVSLAQVLKQVPDKNVVVKLNCDARDAAGGEFEEHFNLVKDRLGDTMHMKDLHAQDFPFQLQTDLLIDAGWSGWCMPELERPPAMEARVEGLKEQRRIWAQLIENSLKRT